MAWFLNLLMLGKGAPPNGQASFTYLSMTGGIGKPRKFTDKAPSTGIVPTLLFKLMQR